MTEPLVKGESLRMAFGGVEVVKGVDVSLFPGEVHAIVGENGAGKSTIAKMFAGVHKPVGGTISINGKPVVLDGPRHALDLGVALIHQEPLTFPDLDVAENIFVGHQPQRGFLKRVDWRAMREQAKAHMDELGLKLRPDARVGSLSVADQQMVELAAAMSHDARVLLMDETTASLTPKEVAELFDIVRRLRDQGRALAFVSHHLDEIFEIADRITVMRDGQKIAELRPKETSIPELVSLMVTGVSNKRVTAQIAEAKAPGKTMLNVKGLTLPGRFKDVTFDVKAGEIVGMAGLVGAGRTDVCRAIFGIDRPSAGSVEIDGKAVQIKNPRDAMAEGLALVPEDRQHEGLLTSLSLSENATLANLVNVSKKGWLQAKSEVTITEEALAKMRTAFRHVSQPAKELSGGNQQKIVIAKWLMTDPKVLILDEPTRGVDVGAKAEVHRLIRNLANEGLAVLMVSSDLPEVLELSDRVLVMREGHLAANLSKEQANAESVMFAATGQVAHAA